MTGGRDYDSEDTEIILISRYKTVDVLEYVLEQP